jgi:hypothetical protein
MTFPLPVSARRPWRTPQWTSLALALMAICGLSVTVCADTAIGESTTVGGQAFLDVSHIAQQSNGVDVPPTGTGFDAKRFYLIADHSFNDIWSADLTLDAQYSTDKTTTVVTTVGPPVKTTTVTTSAGSGGVTEVFIKKLYLQGKFSDALVGHLGAYTSPWAPFVEGLYGYRYIEKTQTDRLALANTADWGLNASGRVADGLLLYSVSLVNGGGYKNPTRTRDVDVEGRIGVVPFKGLTIGAGFYNGHLGQVTETNRSFATHNATRTDLTAGYVFAGLHVGAEYFSAKNFKTVNSAAAGVYGTSAVVAGSATTPVPSDRADGFSSWLAYDFNARLSVFGRYDAAKLSRDVDPRLKDTYFNIGVAYKPARHIDLALVYKNEKVDNGATSIGSADANGSYTIGGINATTGGKFEEIGIYSQFSF